MRHKSAIQTNLKEADLSLRLAVNSLRALEHSIDKARSLLERVDDHIGTARDYLRGTIREDLTKDK